MANGARDDVEEHGDGEADDAGAAEHHQRGLQRIERPPLQMAVTLQDEGAVHEGATT